jgi:hypothetical protein
MYLLASRSGFQLLAISAWNFLEDLAAARLGDLSRNFTQPNSNIVIHGIAIAPCGIEEQSDLITYIIEEVGIPVITFDSDITLPDVPLSAHTSARTTISWA